MSGPNNHPGLNVGFDASSVDFEQAVQVDQDGGISMEEFDGREAPVHARKVSVRKPEIIALFEYHPIFKEIMQGDDEEKQKVLTDAGRYIDTQITARKIRLDDIKLLFEQLSKDPESPTGQIVENLIGVLESKITDVKNDFEAIKTVSDAVLQFLDTLDLRRPSTSQQAVFGSLRAKRFEDNPLRLPKSEDKSIDFNRMMLNNFGESASEEPDDQGNLEGSGTKMFLNFLVDLEALMHGPIQFPNPKIAQRADEDTGDSDVFSLNRSNIMPIVDITNGYGVKPADGQEGAATPFGGGVCSMDPTSNNGSGKSFYAQKAAGRSPDKSPIRSSIDNPRFQDIFYMGRHLNNGQACAVIAQTLVDDLAASAALGSDDIVSDISFLNPADASPGAIPTNFPTDVSGLKFLSANRQSRSNVGFSLNEATDVMDRQGLLSTALYDPDVDGPKSPIRTFDPGVLSVPDDDGVAKKIQNTAYDQLLKPILETMQEGNNVNTAPLEAFVTTVPDSLSKTADLLDQYFATSDPVLNPKSILIKVLTSIRNRIPDLNIGEGVDFSDEEQAPMAAGPMIDFCLLAEASRDVKMNPRYGAISTAMGNYTCQRMRVNDLLTMFLISLSKTSSTTGKYSSIIAIPKLNDDDPSPNFFTIGRNLAKHIRMNLLNTYTNVRFPGERTVQVNTPFGRRSGLNNAIQVMSMEDSIALSRVDLEFEEGSSGVAPENFAGKKYSASRRANETNVKISGWRLIQEKLDLDIENAHPAIVGTGALMRDDDVDSGRSGNLAGMGTFNTVRTGGAFDIHPVKRIYGSQIEERLTGVVGINRKESIFSDIVDVVNEIYDAAVARGPIVDGQTGKMISSGVDPAYVMSLVISLYSIAIKDLLGIRFSPASFRYRNDESNDENRANINRVALALWRDQDKKTSALMQISNVVRSREVISDLNNFLTAEGEVDTLPGAGSHLGRFLSRFNEQADGNARLRLDAIDMLRTLGDSLSTAANRYIESFVNDNNQIRVDEQFERIKAVLPLAIDRTQVTAMRNQLQNVDSKEGFSRYFDDFMLSQAQENFFYGSLFGPGQGFQTYTPGTGASPAKAQVDDGNRLNFTQDKNISVLTFGIPQGFSKSVLGIDPVLEPERFTERKVDAYVIARDHISGEALAIIPQPYTFDLGLFFDSVSDPIVSSPQTNSKLNEETSPEFLSNFNQSIANRKYPTRQEIFQGSIKMRRILLETGRSQVVSRPIEPVDGQNLSLEQNVFDNHVYDMLAKIYVKVTTGMSVTENDFFVDSAIEQKLATEPDLRNLSNLMNTHISQLLGRDVTFNDYLSGDRKFRELLNRLSKGEKTSQIIDEIKVNLEGTTEDANTLSSEDLVAFSRMISSNNPVITPGLFRDKIVSPRLFERVFSIFINPDKFVGIPYPGLVGPNRRAINNNQAVLKKRNFLDEMRFGNTERIHEALSRGVDTSGEVVTSRVGLPRDLLIDYKENQNLPIATMYQVLVVPHGTPVDFFEEEEE